MYFFCFFLLFASYLEEFFSHVFYRQRKAALQLIVDVLCLPETILDKEGVEMTLSLCSLDEFVEILKDHLLSTGQDMHAHDIDIHEYIRYVDEPAPSNPERTIP